MNSGFPLVGKIGRLPPETCSDMSVLLSPPEALFAAMGALDLSRTSGWLVSPFGGGFSPFGGTPPI